MRAVVLAPQAHGRVAAARAVVDRLAASDTPVYGVTSALGANTGKPIAEAERIAYQLRAVRARAVGVGPRHSRDVVRAMMFARAAGMAMGGSGVSPAVLEALVAMLNAQRASGGPVDRLHRRGRPRAAVAPRACR